VGFVINMSLLFVNPTQKNSGPTVIFVGKFNAKCEFWTIWAVKSRPWLAICKKMSQATLFCITPFCNLFDFLFSRCFLFKSSNCGNAVLTSPPCCT